MDDLDVLDVAQVAARCGEGAARGRQGGPGGRDAERSRSSSARGAIKALEERHKRELTAREREGVLEVLNVAESWLRDCLAISQGVGDLVANTDVVRRDGRSRRGHHSRCRRTCALAA